VSAHNLAAQNTGNDNAASGGNQGGGRRNRGQGGNFDPAQMQQRMMERVREQLNFTNDTEWSAIEPLVQKVMEAQRDARSGGMARLFSRSRGGNNNDGVVGRGNFGQQANPDAEALQKAIDDNAPASQVKDLLAKYKVSQKARQTKLSAAQADLQKVLTVKQEAQATLLGLVE
jgi:hypothetical protein